MVASQQQIDQAVADTTVDQQRESAARQLVTAGLLHLKQLPSPDLASEAIATGATPDIVNAMQDPALAPYMGEQQQGKGTTYPADNGPGKAGPDVFSFDWNAYWHRDNAAQLQQDDNFQQLGEVPQMNVGYLQGVMNSDPNSGRKWQGWLQAHGFLDPKHQQDGHWDSDTQAALRAYMISLAMPESLYAKDPQRQAQASQFLNALGIDPQDVHDQIGRDPNFQRGMALEWMRTRRPSNPLDAMHEYADRFGADKLPQTYQQINSDSSLMDTLGALNEMSPMGMGNKIGEAASGALSHLPLVGGLFGDSQAVSQAADATIDPRAKKAQEINAQLAADEKNMTPEQAQYEQSVLGPAVQQAQEASGFLPFSWWDRQRNNVILTARYYGGDLIGGKGPSFGDVFDPNSSIGKAVAAHNDNLTAGILGDQWAQDHPTVAAITNTAANVVDDPITWLGPGLLRAARLPADLMRASGAARKAGQAVEATEGAGLRAAIDARSPTRVAVDRFLHPAAEAERQQAALAFANKDRRWTLVRLLRTNSTHTDTLTDVLDRIEKATTPEEVRQIVNENLDWKFHGAQGIVQREEALNTMTPEAFARGGEDLLGKMRSIGSMAAESSMFDPTRVVEAGNTVENLLVMAGYRDQPSVIADAMEEFVRLPAGDRERWVHTKLVDLLNDSPQLKPRGGLQAVRDHGAALRRGGTFARNQVVNDSLGPVSRVRQAMYAPAQRGSKDVTEGGKEVGQETSLAPRHYPPATLAYAQRADEAVVGLQQMLRQTIDDMVSELMERNPKLGASTALQSVRTSPDIAKLEAETARQVQQVQAHVDELFPLGVDRPAPLVEGQLQRKAAFPVTPYEMASFVTPALRNYERVAARMRLDAFHSIWKGFALARIATDLRMMVGDDTSRFLRLIADGHPLVAAKAFGLGTARGLQTLGVMVPGLRSRTLARADAQMQLLNRTDRLTLSRAFGEADTDVFHSFDPMGTNSDNYEQAFPHHFRVFAGSPSVRVWAQERLTGDAQSALQKLKDHHAEADAGTVELVKLRKGEAMPADTKELMQRNRTTVADTDQLAEAQAQYFEAGFAKHRTVLKWYADGEIGKEFSQLFKDHPEVFPVIQGPTPTVFSRNAVVRGLRTGPRALFDHVAEPMIRAARAEAGVHLRQMYVRRIEQMHPDWAPEKIGNLATAETQQWMDENLYNGQRSIAGRAARHAFPFAGATMNMTSFWMRTLRAHPRLIEPFARAINAQEAQAAQGPDKHTLLGSSVLEALGFSGGDALTWNPAHIMFITSDGIASFVPGYGPIFSALTAPLVQEPHVSAIVSQIPGLREQASFQALGPSIIPSWMGQQVNAILLASPVHRDLAIPFITGDPGTYQRELDNKGRQLYADYLAGRMDHVPTPEDIASALGRDLLTGGIVGDILPVTPSVVDERRQQLTQANTEWDTATTPAERDALLAKYGKTTDPKTGQVDYGGVSAYLAYYDPRTTLDQRDALVNQSQWLAPYVTSVYDEKGPKPVSQQEFDAGWASGRITALSTDSFVPRVTAALEMSDGWAKYRAYQNAAASARANNGWTPQSKEYLDWYHQHIDPQIQALETSHPTWRDQFLKQGRTDVPGLTAQTQPIRSVATWEVIPQMAGMETPLSTSWSKALTWVQDAAAAIQQLRSERASLADQQAVLDTLNAKLQAEGAQSPDFANQLQHFGTRRFDDISALLVQEARDQGAPA